MTKQFDYYLGDFVNFTAEKHFPTLVEEHAQRAIDRNQAVAHYSDCHNEMVKAGEYRELMEDYEAMHKAYIHKLLDTSTPAQVEKVRMTFSERFKKHQVKVQAFQKKYATPAQQLAVVGKSRDDFAKQVSMAESLLEKVKSLGGLSSTPTVKKVVEPPAPAAPKDPTPYEALRLALVDGVHWTKMATAEIFDEYGVYGCSSPEHWSRSDGVKVLQESLKETNGTGLAQTHGAWLRWCQSVDMNYQLAQDIWAREAIAFMPT